MSNEGRVERGEILPLLLNPRKDGTWVMAFCPSHADGQKHGGKDGRSLGLSDTGVLKCFAGCQFKDVIQALRDRAGIRKAPRQGAPTSAEPLRTQPRKALPTPTRTYEYRHPYTGDLIAVKGRFESPNPDGGKPAKTFFWRLPQGDFRDGIAPLTVAELPLWHAADAIATTGRVWFCEGESATEALIARNEVAVCGAWGAGQTDYGVREGNPGALEILRGKHVILWPDNDEPGRRYMGNIKLALQGIAAKVSVVNAAVPPKGDAVEFFQSGQTIEGLLAGSLLEPTVDVLAEDHYRVRIPTEAGVVSFEFEEVYKRGARSMEAEITVSFRHGEPYSQRIDVMSQSAREGLVRQLNAQYGKDSNWTTVVSIAYSRMRQAHTEVVAGSAELVGGDEAETVVPWLVKDYVIDGGGTILFGQPGDGKSWTAMLMAVSVDAGSGAMFDVARTGPALYINLERSRESMTRRLGRVNEVLGIHRGRQIFMINRRGRTLMDVLPSVKAAIARHGIRFVVLDSVSRAGAGDLNSNETGNRIMDILNSLGVAWLAIAHAARPSRDQKPGDSHTYGSIMQDAAADIVVGIVSERSSQNTLGVGLQVSKGNDIGAVPLREWAYLFDEFGLKSVRPARDGEFAAVSASAKVSLTAEVINFVAQSGAATTRMVADALGRDPSNISKILRSKRFVFVRQDGKDRYYGVALKDDGDHDGEPSFHHQHGEEKMMVVNTISIGTPSSPSSPTYLQEEPNFICYRCSGPAEAWSDSDTPQPVCAKHAS